MNNFKFVLGKISSGWTSIELYNGDDLMIGMSGTGVYNPFYEFPKILKSIITDSSYLWVVDQEGYDGSVKFSSTGKSIIIETEELKNNSRYPKLQVTFDKEQVKDELYTEIIRWESENREEMSEGCYDFWFNVRELVSLYEMGYYDHEIIKETIYQYKNETIVSEYDTKKEKTQYLFNGREKSSNLQSLLRKTILYGEVASLEDMEGKNSDKSDLISRVLKEKKVDILKGYCRDDFFHAFF